MSVKRSIAILGATEEAGKKIAFRLMHLGFSLLLISNHKEALDYLSKNIEEKKPKAEINFIECVKDGCWEADIIILAVEPMEENRVAKLMKEVATQKIVVSISNKKNTKTELQKILPYSRLVTISNITLSDEIFISGNDSAANEEISMIFKLAGYYPIIKESSRSII